MNICLWYRKPIFILTYSELKLSIFECPVQFAHDFNLIDRLYIQEERRPPKIRSTSPISPLRLFSPSLPLSLTPSPLPVTPSLHHPTSPPETASRVFDRSKGWVCLKGWESSEGFLQKINLHCVKLLSTIPSVRKSIGYWLLFVMIIFMICQILRLNSLHLL